MYDDGYGDGLSTGFRINGERDFDGGKLFWRLGWNGECFGERRDKSLHV